MADRRSRRNRRKSVLPPVLSTGPFNEGGVIQVNWDAAPNATGYIIYAVNVDELNNPDGQIVVAPVNDAAKPRRTTWVA